MPCPLYSEPVGLALAPQQFSRVHNIHHLCLIVCCCCCCPPCCGAVPYNATKILMLSSTSIVGNWKKRQQHEASTVASNKRHNAKRIRPKKKGEEFQVFERKKGYVNKFENVQLSQLLVSSDLVLLVVGISQVKCRLQSLFQHGAVMVQQVSICSVLSRMSVVSSCTCRVIIIVVVMATLHFYIQFLPRPVGLGHDGFAIVHLCCLGHKHVGEAALPTCFFDPTLNGEPVLFWVGVVSFPVVGTKQ
jgi:hypothetical protein